MSDLPPLSAVIAEHGLSAKKSLGQNFLLDLNLTAKIARAAGPLEDQTVIEVGPGPGGLTRGLLAEGAKHVIAIERDERLRPVLEEISSAYPGRLTAIFADALTLDERALLKDLNVTGPVSIAANLPYNIGTALLVKWLTGEGKERPWPPPWQSLTLMFQKEVAERITAAPGGKAWGRLAILSDWRAERRILFDLPPRAFVPPPKVTSSVVRLDLREKPLFEADAKTLERLVAAAFGQRRKMLRQSLKGLHPDMPALLASAGIDETARPETLTTEAFCALARLLKA